MSSEQPSAWITLSSAELSAEIDPLGAQLSALRDRVGRDLLWEGDPSIWAGRAPILFPIVGALAGGSYRLWSTRYRLPRHGFARTSPFGIAQSSANTATFNLKADDATRALYPFPFELEIHFALDGATISLAASIRNQGDVPMPASFGYHPAFRWPLPFGQPRSAHCIEFERDEPSPARRLDASGLLTSPGHATPIIQRRLVLTDALFENDAVIFDDVRSRAVGYGASDGPRIRLSFPDTRYLGVWTKPGANFICIEPWHGIADSQGYAGDFTAKPGIFTVAPRSSVVIRMAITLLEQ